MGVIQAIQDDGVDYYSDFPYISAKTGAGKTTDAVLSLRDYIEKRTGNRLNKVILILPIANLKNEILEDERFGDKVVGITKNVLKDSNRTEETIVTTCAKLSMLLEDKELKLDNTLLIFDELHRFIDFTTWQPQMSYLLERLLDPMQWERFVAVGMTGTPRILDYCTGLPFEFKNITPNTHPNLFCDEGLLIRGGSIESYADLLIKRGFEGAKLIFIESAATCYKIAERFKDAGYEAAFIISKYHDRHTDESGKPLNQVMMEQIYDDMSIIDWINQKNDVPKTLNVLIINSSSSEGINILDSDLRFNEAIIESPDRSTIEQARSRIRHDLPQLTVIHNGKTKNLSIEKIKDALVFYQRFEDAKNDGEQEKMLLDRFLDQDGRTYQIVMHGQKLFLNPFIKATIRYVVQNYYFSQVRNSFNADGIETVEQTVVTFEGKRLPTFESWKASLEPMIKGKRFVYRTGKEIREELLETVITDKYLKKYIQMDVWYNIDEIRELAKSINFKDVNGSVWGYQKLIEMIPKLTGINVFSNRLIPHKESGKNKRHYCFTYGTKAPRKKKNQPYKYYLS